ncbi:TSUP family transporter [Bartonella tamiae]|uniref:Probable membrane transporter protein n=1 Tax=Bartonella tamiae Th239 TaxID=1094558 RepID=J0ZKR1_9HYPH|nr:TSUP family transporter [Bartonella tamiae]EJF88928.1 hypothetical protein ME5_01479 [Bartonella tamiae Th239]EJF94822.1 hypothetical protein MEG_00403 [Bartonella tamiae Th307]
MMFAFLIDPTTLILIVSAFIAGIIDSIAGGGGLITIPILLLTGVQPITALGTNKLQSLFGSFSATLAYARAGQVNIYKQWNQALLAFIGSVIGAMMAFLLPITVLQIFLPFLLIIVALYFTLKPNLNDVDKAQRIRPILFACIIVPIIGFYDGIFGPGAGSFYMLAFIGLAGYGILKATAHTKLLNFTSNLGGFLTFAFIGSIDFRIGLVMGVAQFIGAQIGAQLALRTGAKLIKPLLVIISLILAIKLLSDPHNPLRIFLHL